MKHRILALGLALCLTVSLLAMPAGATDTAGTDLGALQTVRALGILVGDGRGNLNLEGAVTRAQFAKMLVSASPYRDTVGDGTGSSLFRDVKSNYWAAEYIKIAVDSGWMVGYVDGSFRPEKTIKLEEGCTAALRLLGYQSKDLAGSFPSAQLSKAAALGLRDSISLPRGGILTRGDCMYLFYNLMTAKTAAGAVYATTLGYSLTAGGQLDYAALVSARMSGPFVLGSDTKPALPFSTAGATVYRNGKDSTLSAAAAYDVYYYNSDLRTIWMFDNKVTGTYTAATPSATAPASVTVAGVTYPVSGAAAAFKLSAMGSYRLGDVVTLLLGMDGSVVDVADSAATAGYYYGVVTATGTADYKDGDGKVSSSRFVKVICTDGVTRQFETGKAEQPVGALVTVDYDGKTGTVRQLTSKSMGGRVSADGTRLGEVSLAPDVEILDTTADGHGKAIYATRIAGTQLAEKNVVYYSKNDRGEIDRLILRDATGDAAVYGLVTDAMEVGGGPCVYSYLMGGVSGTLSTGARQHVSSGGAVFGYKDGGVDKIANLTEVAIDSVTGLTGRAGERTYAIAEDAQVYVNDGVGRFTLSNLTTVTGSDRYTLRGYTDTCGGAGGRVRVLLATAKP
ncbi:MAG: S-layer homology domain-containing protein [Oscillospiraceae bacterium]